MTTYAIYNSDNKLMMRFPTLIAARNYLNKMTIMIDDDLVLIVEV